MTNNLINESALKYIIKDVELTLLKLGIKTELALKDVKDHNDGFLKMIESTDFQTTPVIFKKLNIEGLVRATICDGYIKVVFKLVYSVQTFDNVYNCYNLGRIVYNIDRSYTGKYPENAHLYIDKVESLKL